MAWLSSLFARSPFGPIQEHQHKVQECAELTTADHRGLPARRPRSGQAAGASRSRRSSTRPTRSRTGCGTSCPSSLFMPVSRSDLLNVLVSPGLHRRRRRGSGGAADHAADGAPAARRWPSCCGEHVRACLEVVHQSTEVVEQLDTLVQRLLLRARGAARAGDDRSRWTRRSTRRTRSRTSWPRPSSPTRTHFKPAAIYLWMKIFNKVGDLANYAEKMTHRVRLFMAKGG